MIRTCIVSLFVYYIIAFRDIHPEQQSKVTTTLPANGATVPRSLLELRWSAKCIRSHIVREHACEAICRCNIVGIFYSVGGREFGRHVEPCNSVAQLVSPPSLEPDSSIVHISQSVSYVLFVHIYLFAELFEPNGIRIILFRFIPQIFGPSGPQRVFSTPSPQNDNGYCALGIRQRRCATKSPTTRRTPTQQYHRNC